MMSLLEAALHPRLPAQPRVRPSLAQTRLPCRSRCRTPAANACSVAAKEGTSPQTSGRGSSHSYGSPPPGGSCEGKEKGSGVFFRPPATAVCVAGRADRKRTRLNSSHLGTSYAAPTLFPLSLHDALPISLGAVPRLPTLVRWRPKTARLLKHLDEEVVTATARHLQAVVVREKKRGRESFSGLLRLRFAWPAAQIGSAHV